jgi:hypothetical protein
MNMIKQFVANGLAVQPLSLKGGKGVFTTRPFARGNLLVVWDGDLVSGAELKELTTEQRIFSLQVDDDLHQVTPIDKIFAGDFINHSCEPNAGLSDAISLVALRDIRSGEEICFDYATSDSNIYSEFSCECGQAACRGFVRHDDWRRADLQRKYSSAFSPYLRRRIETETLAYRLAKAPNQRSAQLDQNRGALVNQTLKAVPIENKHFDFIDGSDSCRSRLIVK